MTTSSSIKVKAGAFGPGAKNLNLILVMLAPSTQFSVVTPAEEKPSFYKVELTDIHEIGNRYFSCFCNFDFLEILRRFAFTFRGKPFF